MAVLTLYCDAAAGADTNGGSSAGAAKVSGADAETWGTATVTFGGAVNLSTVAVGDTIQIGSRTDGRSGSNIFEVTAVSDASDYVLVTPFPAVGDAQAWAIGGAWVTIDKAMNSVVAGDTVNVKGSANYNELATIDIVGTHPAPIHFRGYTTTPGDGGQATVSGQSTRANCIVDSVAANTNVFYVFEDLTFTLATADGVLLDINNTIWKNCHFDANGTTSGDGFQGGQAMFEGCTFNDNSGAGARIDRQNALFIGCRALRNGLDGIIDAGATGASLIVQFCTFFSNAGVDIAVTTPTDMLICIVNCTVDGDADDSTIGIDFGTSTSSGQLVCIVNTVVYDCATGIRSGEQGVGKISRNNLVNANGANYSGFATLVGEVTSAPAFENEATNDYRPATGSPLLAAGYDANVPAGFTEVHNIGAFAGAEACDYPAVGDVQNGVQYNFAASTGTFVAPAVGDVQEAVGYGAGGTEFTGTFGVPAVGSVAAGVGYGAGGTEFTGTLAVTPAGGGGMKTGGQL